MSRAEVRAEKRRIRATLEAYRVAKRIGLTTPQAVALAKVLRRSPRWKRRLRAALRRAVFWLSVVAKALILIVAFFGFAAAMGISIARLILGDPSSPPEYEPAVEAVREERS